MATTSAPPHVLLAGGGTGGHVFPALAVGDELRARGWRVSFVGMAGGMEERLVGERGVPFHGLPAKPLVGRGPLGKARALATLAGSAFAARRLVRETGAGRRARHRRLRLGAGRARGPARAAAGRAAGAERQGRSRQPLALALGHRRLRGLPGDDRRPQVPLLGDRRAGARGVLPGPGRAAADRPRRACWCSAAARGRSRSTRPCRPRRRG